MDLSKKIIIGITIVLQTIIIIVLAISVGAKKGPTLTCQTEYKYKCSKAIKNRDGFDQAYYEEYTVNKEGLIISRVVADKYLFKSKEEYDLQNGSFEPMEGYEITKDDKKREIVVYRNEKMESSELWYRLVEQNLEERDYVCEEIID